MQGGHDGSKKAANKAGSIRQRPDGRWEGRITVGVNPATGKPQRRSIYGDSQAAVRREMTAILASLDSGTYQAPAKMKVGEWFDTCLTTYWRNSVKPLTLQTYEGIIKNHIKPAIGGMEVQAVRGVDVQRLFNGMTAAGSSGKTIRNVSAIMHKAFSIAIKQGYITSNPVDAAEPPKVVRHEVKPLTDAEIPLFLEAIEESPYKNAYALCLFAGLREAECMGLSWGQVDFKAQTITVDRQLQKSKTGDKGYYIAHTTKSGKARTIKPPPIAFQYLRDEQAKQIGNRLCAGKAWSNEWDLVFTDDLGGHYRAFTFYSRFKRIAASIGRPDARPHDLRHTAATVALASGADVKSVQSLLGHSTASFTLNVYAHSTERMMKDTADRMQTYYDGLQKKA